MWLSSDSSSFVNCRAHRPTRVRVSPSAPFRGRNRRLKNSGEALLGIIARRDLCLLRPSFKLFAPVAQASERRASNAEVAGEIPAGSANHAALAQLL